VRKSVAQFLEPRICPDTILVNDQPVAAEALALLRANLVWSVAYDEGRLLGEVILQDLLSFGELGPVRAYLAASARQPELLRRAVAGERLDPSAFKDLTLHEAATVLLAQRAAGAPMSAAALAEVMEALGASLRDDLERSSYQTLQARLAAAVGGLPWGPLTDEPIEALSETQLDRPPEPDTFLFSGDLAGSLRQLERAIAREEEEDRRRAARGEDPPWAGGAWPRLAAVRRLLTGDDAAAMALLERARFCDVHDAWPRLFGAAGRARVQREKDEVLAVIEAAFDGVPFPGPEHRSLYQAEAADNRTSCDQSRDHKGRWQDLPREQLLECQWALPHLGAASLPYYLPAIMSFAVRERDQRREDHKTRWIFEAMEYHLKFYVDAEHEELRQLKEARHSQLTRAQLGAIARFADFYCCEDEDRRRWHALAGGAAWPASRGAPS
jgi:hypothetical protein